MNDKDVQSDIEIEQATIDAYLHTTTLQQSYHVMPQEDYTALLALVQTMISKSMTVCAFCAGEWDGNQGVPSHWMHEDTCPILQARALVAKLTPQKESNT